MIYLILITLIGLNLAPFIFHNLDIWHAQGIWSQLSILVLFSSTFFVKPIKEGKNIPLGILHLWVGLWTAYVCYLSQVMGQYNINSFFPYFNFLCLIIFYRIITEHITGKEIGKILVWMKYAVVVTLFMAVLQKFGVSQFFQVFEKTDPNEMMYNNNPVVGFIGNGTHLSGFLAMCVPLFLVKVNRENILSLVLMFLVLIDCGTTIGDPSITGFIIYFTIIGIYLLAKHKKIFILALLLFLIGAFLIYPHLPEDFFNPQSRGEMWGFYWDKAVNHRPVTGLGLGKVNQIYKMTPFPKARHLHNEYLQYFFEIGLIGIIGILYCIKDFFSIRNTNDLQFYLKLIVLGFLISSLLNFSSHLWLPSVWVMFAYAATYSIKNEEYYD